MSFRDFFFLREVNVSFVGLKLFTYSGVESNHTVEQPDKSGLVQLSLTLSFRGNSVARQYNSPSLPIGYEWTYDVLVFMEYQCVIVRGHVC